MTTPPPGYYPDDSGTSRWWDGERWSDLPAPVTGAPPAGAAPTPPQGFAPPPAAAGRGRLAALLVTIGLVVVAGIGVGVWAMTRSDDGRTPRATVQALVDGMLAGDCDRVVAVTTQAYRSDSGLDCATIEAFPGLVDGSGTELVVGEQVSSGDTSAEVLVRATYGGEGAGSGEDAPEPSTTRFTLTLVEGEWLVAADAQEVDPDAQE